MTQTTNIGLKKIDGSENWRQIFDYHNDSADKTDSAVAAVQDGLAIVANGNTHAAVEEGQFVYVRNHSTLAEGLYKASSAIGTNGELTTSNLTADGSGGLNDLQEQVTSLNSNIANINPSVGYASGANLTAEMKDIYDKVTTTGKTVLCDFQESGRYLGVVYKYPDNAPYGMMLATEYTTGNVYKLSVSNGTATLYKLTGVEL